jgi:hypothetical protein
VAAPRYDTVTGNSRVRRLGDGVKVSLRQHRKQPCSSRAAARWHMSARNAAVTLARPARLRRDAKEQRSVGAAQPRYVY